MTEKIISLLENANFKNVELAIQLSSNLPTEQRFLILENLLKKINHYSADYSEFNCALIKFAEECLGAKTLIVDTMSRKDSSFEYIHLKETYVRGINEMYYIKHSDYKIQDKLFKIINSHEQYLERKNHD